MFPTVSFTDDVVHDARTALAESGAALITGAGLSDAGLAALVSAIHGDHQGRTDPHAFEKANALQPQAASGMFPLPLHRDAALIGRPTRIIGFQSSYTTPETPTGLLELVDTVRAINEIDQDLLDTLTEHPLEYCVPDRRPFPFLPESWFRRPVFTQTSAGQALRVILPVDIASPPWLVRLVGLDDAESRKVLRELDTQLRGSTTFVAHHWTPGDVFLVDNSRVLHGITAVPAGALHRTVRQSV
ncbi:TauD/TfdA family dioxygenase [Hoyosella rhizosphaerae]|uniref:TauD/TfdA-like domain-containing protein n=1 Tax=Hoyosella rhizosphaerae TaxID=1755582 RepID=A0A916U0P3_9ACTN|nr:TauD/TfdA family dioxygenase [Hoyosella rhizosphaerae]MBN4927052.1 TauD/TfdA family dioxygenase [Hoyosella rhizosphaerae]GGC54431.1 hypothetical protein GCM10011410_03490 [Hoyosella rhizosphaerae]